MLRNIEIDRHYNPKSLNPPIYWHVAELYGGEGDNSLRFAIAMADSYQVTKEGRFLRKEPLVSTFRIGLERYREANSLHIYFYFSNDGKFKYLDISDNSDGQHRGWITIDGKEGVTDSYGTMEILGGEVEQLPVIHIDNLVHEFIQIDEPLNLREAFGIISKQQKVQTSDTQA